jgi:hypothetical protein
MGKELLGWQLLLGHRAPGYLVLPAVRVAALQVVVGPWVAGIQVRRCIGLGRSSVGPG